MSKGWHLTFDNKLHNVCSYQTKSRFLGSLMKLTAINDYDTRLLG